MTQAVPPRSTGYKLAAVFAAGVVLGAVSAVAIVPAGSSSSLAAAGNDAPNAPIVDGTVAPGARPSASASAGARATAGTVPGQQGANPVALPPARPGLACEAGKNGGATDRGVTATSITLGTTVAQSGPGKDFLAEMRIGMEAVAKEVNAAGGICGRTLEISYVDDGWDRARGAQYLRNYVQKPVFAIPVGASSEGLAVVIDSGDLERGGPPVVGTDGLSINQYVRHDKSAQPWVWPIATATVSSARIMADDAYKRGARKLAIVFDNNYKFGREAATAFNAEVRRLTGSDVVGFNAQNTCVKSYCGITANQNSYSAQVAEVYNSGPDFVALFMEPGTAQTWMGDANTPSASIGIVHYGYGAAQPLFTKQFEANCRSKCDQMVVWTGFKPNVEAYADDPAVRAYARALTGVERNADVANQFTEGAYIGMRLLVDALRAVGPDLTRERLRAVLDGMTLKSGLTIQPGLTFTPSTRYANVTMQAFTMQYKGSSGGWRAGVIARDPHPEAGADA